MVVHRRNQKRHDRSSRLPSLSATATSAASSASTLSVFACPDPHRLLPSKSPTYSTYRPSEQASSFSSVFSTWACSPTESAPRFDPRRNRPRTAWSIPYRCALVSFSFVFHYSYTADAVYYNQTNVLELLSTPLPCHAPVPMRKSTRSRRSRP